MDLCLLRGNWHQRKLIIFRWWLSVQPSRVISRDLYQQVLCRSSRPVNQRSVLKQLSEKQKWAGAKPKAAGSTGNIGGSRLCKIQNIARKNHYSVENEKEEKKKKEKRSRKRSPGMKILKEIARWIGKGRFLKVTNRKYNGDRPRVTQKYCMIVSNVR